MEELSQNPEQEHVFREETNKEDDLQRLNEKVQSIINQNNDKNELVVRLNTIFNQDIPLQEYLSFKENLSKEEKSFFNSLFSYEISASELEAALSYKNNPPIFALDREDYVVLTLLAYFLKDIEGINLEGMKKQALIMFSKAVHHPIIKEKISSLSDENQQNIAKLFYLFKIYEPLSFLFNKQHEHKEMNAEQIFDFFMFYSANLNFMCFALEENESITNASQIWLGYCHRYFKNNTLDLYHLEDFISYFFKNNFFLSNYFVKHFDFFSEDFKETPFKELLKEDAAFKICSFLTTREKILRQPENEAKLKEEFEKENNIPFDLNKELIIHIEEFLSFFEPFIAAKAKSLEGDEKQFFLDSLSYLNLELINNPRSHILAQSVLLILSHFYKNDFLTDSISLKALKLLLSDEEDKIIEVHLHAIQALHSCKTLMRYKELPSPFAFFEKNQKASVKDYFNELIRLDLGETHFLISDLLKAYKEMKTITEANNNEDKDFIVLFLKGLLEQKFVVKNKKDVEGLKKLKEDFPNFVDVIDYYIACIELKINQPVLLFGDSGVGKSYFIERLGQVFESYVLDCALLERHNASLLGTSSVYKDSRSGIIFDFFTSTKSTPLFVLDNFEVTPNRTVINSLIDKETCKRFKDEFFNFSIDLTHGFYIALAKDLEPVKNQLSSFNVFKIEHLNQEEKRKVILKIWSEMSDKLLSEEILAEIEHNSLKEIKKILTSVVMLMREKEVTLDDVYELIKKERELSIVVGAQNFTLVNPAEIKHSLEDVRGLKEAKGQISEIIQFFKTKDLPKGLSRPKGLVLYGSAGVGKTMLAKAFAKEVNMPFLAMSGSSFVEQYVGVGAKRVRDLFSKARQYKPCVIYIDEIDALGKRGDSSNSERDATINEFLVQLDGAKDNDGIFVIASTNYLDNLDEALIREGRFDRKIEISLPSFDDRKDIIQHIMKKYEVVSDLDVERIARMTYNQSPAFLQALFNQASIIAFRNNETLNIRHLEEADEELVMGIKTSIEQDENKRITAYHEVGHAVVGMALERHLKVRRVTITPRANSLGLTYSTPEKDLTNITKQHMLNSICATLAGRAAEELFIGSISTGASSDIRMVTNRAKDMIMKYGFAEDGFLSMMLFEDLKDVSEATKQKIENECLRIIREQYEIAKDILLKYQEVVHKMATLLMDKEVLDEDDLKVFEKEFI